MNNINNSNDNTTQVTTEKQKKSNKIISYSKNSFYISVGVLVLFMIVAIVLTYVLPKGHFAISNGVTDYNNFVTDTNASGINIFKGIFAPIMMFTADGWIQPLMLIIFLLVIAGVFQVMIDCGGMNSIVRRFVNKFKDKKMLFLNLCILFFMVLGSCFGLFEETLLLLPMVIAVCTSLGYDLSVGFMVCTLATGVGFSVAITNPFTVVYASNLIGVSITNGIWFRLIIFMLYYALLVGFIFVYTKRLNKNKKLASGSQNDELQHQQVTFDQNLNDKKQFITYLVFLSIAFISIIVFASIPALRDINTALLVVVFLVGGLVAGFVSYGVKGTFKSFGRGALSALPSVSMILLAFGIKYILTEGGVIDTITNYITKAVVGQPTFVTILIIFCIILVLEFFVSSSTAKAVFVIGVLAGVLNSGTIAVSKELIVLIYLFSDGFTNVLFPTSPVLLIGLSMTNQSYTGYLKRTRLLFPIIFVLAIALLGVAMLIGY